MTPATIHEAQKLLRQADYLASVNELERAAQKAEDAAMALRAVLRGDHDTAAEVRRVMRHGMEHVSAPVGRVMAALEPEDE